ncbi:MAG: hypothetical protein M8467_10205 [Anaerolineae bacterium]|nr:hypothetical protein [Anaerolineae bacterium]
MSRKVLFFVGILLLAGGALGVGLNKTLAGTTDAECPEGYARVALLEPILPGAQDSKVSDLGCQPIADAERVMLEPIRPGDEDWVVEDKPIDQGEAVNGIVRGPSRETDYRCVILLEPVQSGEQFSKASEPVCLRGAIDSISGVSLDSSYLIARFYDGTNYATLLVEYYGSSACSPTIEYGVADLPDNLDNRFASGKAYSNCDHISVYDFNNYGAPLYPCGANCRSFYALNDNVSSWKTTD